MSDSYSPVRDGLRFGHHVVHYTFMPMLVLLFGALIATPILWFFDVVSFAVAFGLPYAVVGFGIGYISLLGEYVIPAETYRKVRSGEWGGQRE